jgi:hypothetical protein
VREEDRAGREEDRTERGKKGMTGRGKEGQDRKKRTGKDWKDVARASLMEAVLTVLLPYFLNIGGDSNHDVGGPFHHFGYFLVFNNFDDTISLND